MGNLFRLDSKFMQTLSTFGDYVFLNVLFLICSIPIFTMGAARSALYRAMFEMQEGNGALYKKFFKAFKENFKAGTVLFLLKGVIMALLAWSFWLVLKNDILPMRGFFGFSVAAFMVMIAMMSASFGPQVAMFNATVKEFIRNGIYIALSELWRALAVAVMDLAPIFFFLLDPALFMFLLPVWAFLYFSVTTNLAVRLWKKPFDSYIRNAEKQGK